MPQDLLIPLHQRLKIHLRQEVDREVCVVPRHRREDAPFAQQSLVEAGPCRGIQESHHGSYDVRFLDEPNQSLKDRRRILIESHNEAPLHFEPELLHFLHGADEITVPVGDFPAFNQALLIWRFNTDEDGIESGLRHQSHQVVIVSKIDGSLRVEIERVVMSLYPVYDRWKNFSPEFFLVSDEVIVDKKHSPSPAPIVQSIQFGRDLFRGLRPRFEPIENRNVTEFAVVGTSS